MKRLLILNLLLLITSFVISQDSPLWMRYPAISPDGETIVFSYQGDLYTVPAEGGDAKILTMHKAYDYNPVWSPDGKTIAFASRRFGNFDIYTIPLKGGKAKRITTNSSNEYPTAFTPDGEYILFSAFIQDVPDNVQYPTGMFAELYKVPLEGGRTLQVLPTTAHGAQISDDGNKILYYDVKGYENAYRKHHTSSVTRDVWIYNDETGKHTKISSFEGEDRNPVFGPDEHLVYFLSERSGSFNVFSMDKDGDNEVQITSFDLHPVRSLSISDAGKLCYTYDGEIYTQFPDAAPEKVSISILNDERENPIEFVKKTNGARDMDVSADGSQVVFIIRGEVFVTSTEYKTTKRITNTPEQERSVSFSPDGRSVLYASERDGSWNVYQTKIVRDEEGNFANSTLLEESVVIDNEAEEYQPAYSPDGKEVAFLEERETLKVINLDTEKVRTILDAQYNYSYADGDQWYEWSPDGKWFLAEFSPNVAFISDVVLIDAQGNQEMHNLTKSGYGDGRPKWMMDGEMMIWFSDRNGYRSHGSWGSHRDVYAMFLTQEAFDKFNLSKEERELAEKKEKEKDEDGEGKSGDDDEGESNKEKGKSEDKDKDKEELKLIKIDFDNLDERKQRLTIHSSSLSDAVLTPDGKKLFYLARFEKGFNLWSHDFEKKETKLVQKLNSGGGALKLDKKGENLYVFSNGKVMKIGVKSNKKENVSFNAEFYLNKPEEKDYMFEHVWRQVDKKFYNPDLHGVDWDLYKEEYAKFLPYINNNQDYADMLSEMLGELNASHTGSGYRYTDPNGDRTAALGVLVDMTYNDEGIKILEILEKGPMDKSDIKAASGNIIEKIDGVEITEGMDYYPLLNHKSGKTTLLSMYDPETKDRWDITIKPINGGAQSGLLYKRWVKTMRELTDSLSDGKIGYVHVRSMGSGSFREFYSEVLGRNFDKDALIVDTRFNGGGWLHDDLATMLNGKKYAEFYPRGEYYGHEPFNKWVKPSAVLISESNYSDAHGFPFAYKALEIGPLIGMPVPGTMTAVWWETLQDNTLYFGIPQIGVKNLDGEYLENKQLEPDYKVAQDPAIVITGRDEQLEKAVEVLMK